MSTSIREHEYWVDFLAREYEFEYPNQILGVSISEYE